MYFIFVSLIPYLILMFDLTPISKFLFWGLLLSVTCLGLSCNKDLPGFKMEYDLSFDMQAGLSTIDRHIFNIKDIPTNSEQYLSVNGVKDGSTQKITSYGARLYQKYDNYDLSFINRIWVYIYDPFDPTSEPEIFYMDPVPVTNQSTLLLIQSITESSQFLLKKTFGIKVKVELRSASPSFINFGLRLEFLSQNK